MTLGLTYSYNVVAMANSHYNQPGQSNGQNHDLFLSYNNRDRDEVLRVRDRLREQRLSTFLDRDNLNPGQPWFDELQAAIGRVRAVAVFVGETLGPWQKREMTLALDRQAREEKLGRHFPVIPVVLPKADLEKAPGFLLLNTFIDLRGRLDDPSALEAIVRAVRSEAPPPLAQPQVELCPYLALRAFREEDAPLFFGREAFAEQLFLKAQHHNLIAVVGPSGSGKSSVVQAGLMPLLRCESPPRPTWEVIVFTPGTRPFHSLATTLVSIWSAGQNITQRLREAEELSENLQSGKTRLENALSQAITASEGADQLLVVVDQFEELFTLTEEKDRKPFVEALLSVGAVAPVTILLTLRADFYGSAIGLHRELSDRVQQGQVNLGPMTRDELRRAIENPAHSVGLEFESGLVKNILDNIEDQPGNLPLLEFALAELWSKRQGRLLTHRQYEEIGEVEGAIGQRAEQLFGSLKPDSQRAALRAFTRLVRVAAANEEGTDTRQRVRLSDLDETARAVAQQFVKARLLVTSRNEAINEETAEVAHEALIRKWQRLTVVLNTDREFLLWRQRLGFMSREWWRTNKDEGALLDGALLKETKTWSKDRSEELNEQEREFIAASESASQRPRYWIAAAVALLIMGALALGGWRYWDNRPESQINKIIRQWPGYFKAIIAGIAGSNVRDESLALHKWLETMALTGRSDEALAAARNIEDSDYRSRVLLTVVAALAKAGRHEQARDEARNIEYAYYRFLALSRVVAALGKAGRHEQAQQVAAEALAEARKNEDADSRSRALITVVAALAEAGKIEQAQQVAAEALAEAREGVLNRSEALSSVVAALAKAGKTEQALDEARKFENADSRSRALITVVEALAKAGKTEQAQQVVTEAFAEAREWGYYNRLGVLTSVVAALGKAGRHEQAQQIATEALAEARESGFNRSEALSSVVAALAKAGRTEQAQQAAAEALAEARKIEDADSRSGALATAVAALAKAGKTEQALDVALKIEGAYSRSQALVGLVEMLAIRRETADQARTAIEEAQKAAEQIIAEDKKSEALANVATGLAKLHLYRQARELVDNNNTIAKDRLIAYTAILREYHLERHPDQMKLFEEEED